jgi:hypothetical protein
MLFVSGSTLATVIKDRASIMGVKFAEIVVRANTVSPAVEDRSARRSGLDVADHVARTVPEPDAD